MEIMVNTDMNAGVPQSPSLINNLNQRSSLNSELKDVFSDLDQDLNTSRNNIAAIAINNSFILNKENQSILNNTNGMSQTPGNISNSPMLLTPDSFLNNQR